MVLTNGLNGYSGGNGIGPPLPDALLSPALEVAPAALDASEVVRWVTDKERETDALRQRMERDYSLYRLDKYRVPAGYQSYTSNSPAVFADKVISLLTTAERLIKVPYGNKDEMTQMASDMKEKFAIGVLKLADDWLLERMLPPLLDSAAFYSVVRGGWICGRWMFVRDRAGGAHVEVMPWDPLHSFFAMGRSGLLWAVYRTRITIEEARMEYGYSGAEKGGRGQGVEIYDYYDSQINGVIIDSRWYKEPTPHYLPSNPVVIVPIGPAPPVQTLAANGVNSTIEDLGESAFKSIRGINEDFNKVMSDTKTLVNRSLKYTITVESPDGSKTLDDDPYVNGSTISLAMGREKVDVLKAPEMAKETSAMLGLISGEFQRGSLPFTLYGELNFPLSGYAINNLKQGTQSVVIPKADALANFLRLGLNKLVQQYVTGMFPPVTLIGQTATAKTWFEEVPDPQILQLGNKLEVSLIPSLPKDEAASYQIGRAHV